MRVRRGGRRDRRGEHPVTHRAICSSGQHPVLHYGMREEGPGIDGTGGEGAGREGCPLVL